MGDGAALSSYVVPKLDAKDYIKNRIFGGTMPKEPSDKNNFIAMVQKLAEKTPGPNKYNVTEMDDKKWKNAKGGRFAKLSREVKPRSAKSPSLGQYNLDLGFGLTTPRTPGGPMSKGERKSGVYNTARIRAERTPAPGKYEVAAEPEKNMRPSAYFRSHTNESALAKENRKQSAPGPGEYDIKYAPVEKRVPVWGSSKGEVTTFIDKLIKDKSKMPAPGHNGIVEPKMLDRTGQALHTARLLSDRGSQRRCHSAR